MKKPGYCFCIAACLLLLFSSALFAQPVNNLCANAVTITPNTGCAGIAGNLYQANDAGSPPATCGTTNDVWYKFITPANPVAVSITVTPTSTPTSSISTGNTFIEVYNAATCAASVAGNTKGCNNISATATTGALATSTVYYFRVFTTANTSINAAQWGFNVCASLSPVTNDNCAGAITLVEGVTNNGGTVSGATATAGIPVGCATGTPDDDVWYQFTPTVGSATITLSNVGAALAGSGERMQLFSGACGAFASVACGTNTIQVLGLTPGSVYYLRVYSLGNTVVTGTEADRAFSITVLGVNIQSSRGNEVFQQTILASNLADPWEVTYGPDSFLWLTEAKGYRVSRMNPATGATTTVLDISQGSTFTPASFKAQFDINAGGTGAQGGLAGLAIHPDFMHPVTPRKFVYLSYIHKFINAAADGAGVFFINNIVRFTYDPGTDKLVSPVSLCDTLPGSSDHNSQRMIIAPVADINYLFYASGDMGAGQFSNATRPIKSQLTESYEGKILRFNLEADADAGLLDRWIPADNPYNGGTQSAVWSSGMRNNQGFAYANGKLFGSSHGPFSDDELNIIEKAKNYGHPLVIGYAADNNYNNSKASNGSGNTLPLIVNETANAAAIPNYKDPLFSAYPETQPVINNIYNTNPDNNTWPSEGWSGMDVYTQPVIPGWKNSLVVAGLKWGRVLRLKLNGTSDTVVATGGQDTLSYFGSRNRYRDVAFSGTGRDVFVVMDRSAASAGPSFANPTVPACGGCVQKYTFLGYNHNSSTNRSTIPAFIPVTTDLVSTCTDATGVTINSTNNNLWVPITGPDGNIVAEIKANGNNLGLVTSSFFTKDGAVREDGNRRLYLNRNITINTQTQPSSAVNVRLYITKTEMDSLILAKNSAGAGSGVTGVSGLSIYKNSDPCGGGFTTAITKIAPVYAEAHGANGYVLQADITSFSTFYFGNSSFTTLPMELIVFKGALQNSTAVLQWVTANEAAMAGFGIERSIDGISFQNIGTVNAANPASGNATYHFSDNDALYQGAVMVYYRLKIAGDDASFNYSKVIGVAFDPATVSVLVYPNPVKELMKIRISLPKAQTVGIQVSDMNGRIIYTESRFVNNGLGEVSIDTKLWAPQIYAIKITDSKNKILLTQNIVKL